MFDTIGNNAISTHTNTRAPNPETEPEADQCQYNASAEYIAATAYGKQRVLQLFDRAIATAHVIPTTVANDQTGQGDTSGARQSPPHYPSA